MHMRAMADEVAAVRQHLDETRVKAAEAKARVGTEVSLLLGHRLAMVAARLDQRRRSEWWL